MNKQGKMVKRSTASSIIWYLSFTWRNGGAVLVYMPLLALLSLGAYLTELFVVPSILKRVEDGASLAELLLTIALFTALLLLFRGAGRYFINYSEIIHYVPSIVLYRNVIWKANTTSWPNTMAKTVSDMREKAIATALGYRDAPTQIFYAGRDLLRDLLGFTVYLLMLTRFNPLLAGVALVTGIASYFATRRADSWRYEHRDEESQHQARIAYIQRKAESIELAKDIRIYGLQNWLSDINLSVLKAYEDFVAKAKGKQLTVDLISAALTMARNGAAYFLLIQMALKGGMTAAEFLLYFTAVSGFTAWITGILNGFGLMHRYGLQLATVREYLELPEPFRFDGGEEIPREAGCELKLEHVSYRYPDADEDSLRNVDLTIRAGEKLAVVGLNGAGKTTLVRLLCGLVDPTKGRVLLNGKDIRLFDRGDYYELFSAVFQESAVMELTVAENVSQKLPEDTDRARVVECLRDAGLSEKLKTLPNGIDTHLGRHIWDDAMQLSGGETQRLMLARALYKDGPILMLDEPTAALDPIAENDIYLKYNQMTAGKTAVFISHRLASTRFCDRILFLLEGGIAEEGTHKELLALNGKYAELFEIQSRYYKEGSAF